MKVDTSHFVESIWHAYWRTYLRKNVLRLKQKRPKIFDFIDCFFDSPAKRHNQCGQSSWIWKQWSNLIFNFSLPLDFRVGKNVFKDIFCISICNWYMTMWHLNRMSYMICLTIFRTSLFSPWRFASTLFLAKKEWYYLSIRNIAISSEASLEWMPRTHCGLRGYEISRANMLSIEESSCKIMQL